MGKAFAAPVLMSTLLAAALSGCGATGELYPETLAKTGPLPEGSGRIVLLRSDDFSNRNVASPVYVRIQEDLIGKLAHSGFLIAQVAAGDEAIEAAKELCSADAPGFVNGILAAVHREEVTSQ